MLHDDRPQCERIIAYGLERFWYFDHPQFKRARGEVGTLREQLDYIHGRAPAEPLPDAFAERIAETMLSEPEAWGAIISRCLAAAQVAGGAA